MYNRHNKKHSAKLYKTNISIHFISMQKVPYCTILYFSSFSLMHVYLAPYHYQAPQSTFIHNRTLIPRKSRIPKSPELQKIQNYKKSINPEFQNSKNPELQKSRIPKAQKSKNSRITKIKFWIFFLGIRVQLRKQSFAML